MLFGIFPLRRLRQPKTTAVSFLPVELYRPIVEAVDTRRDLHTLLFVSKAFQSESERIIYREIAINQVLRVRLRLFRYLFNCQRVAQRVRKLSIFALAVTEASSYWKAQKYFRAIRQALSALNLLKYLHLVNFASWRYPSVSLLSDCRFQLQSLSIVGAREVDRLALDNQRNVEELHIMGGFAGSFPQATFTRLSTLSIVSYNTPLDPKFIKRIKALRVMFPSLNTIVSTQSRLVHLVSLCLCISQSLLLDIPLLFPSVRYVELLSNDLDFALIQQSMDQFQRLSQLQKVYFSGEEDIFPVQPTQPTVSHWFSQVPSLQSIVIANKATRYSISTHMEWTRGAEDPVEVSHNKDEWKDRRWIA